MQVSISGGTGFIGIHLTRKFKEAGWKINIIDRQSIMLNDEDFLRQKIEGSDVVINLAGVPILKRWNEDYKREIRDSRIGTTRKIVSAIRNAEKKPHVFISGSAIGIYKSEGSHTEESSELADDFMAGVCKDWEKEAMSASGNTRVVIFRIGVVLGKDGGALESMYRPFKMGLGGKVASGKQAFSWISIYDLVEAFMFVIEKEGVSGIVNAVAPYPTDNSHFTETFGKVLNQPAIMRIPGFALRLIFGEAAQALTSGQKVIPDRLLNAGFDFKYPTIEKALMAIYR